MTSEYGMNQSLNPYENLNFEPGLDRDLESFFDSYEPSCEVIHAEEEDFSTEAIMAFIEEEFKGFDDFDPDFGRDPDAADIINWEDIVFCIMEEREAALQNMKLHFSRLEAEAYLELDCTSNDVSWYAGSVLKHLSLLKRAGAILDLLPTKGECEKTLAILTGIEQ